MGDKSTRVTGPTRTPTPTAGGESLNTVIATALVCGPIFGKLAVYGVPSLAAPACTAATLPIDVPDFLIEPRFTGHQHLAQAHATNLALAAAAYRSAVSAVGFAPASVETTVVGPRDIRRGNASCAPPEACAKHIPRRVAPLARTPADAFDVVPTAVDTNVPNAYVVIVVGPAGQTTTSPTPTPTIELPLA